MQPELVIFLARHRPLAGETTISGQGRFAFRVTGYLTDELPPLEFVTSVRSLVFRGDTMLCLLDPDGVHLFPGGRREPGETLEGTLRRELLEEAGCSLTAVSRLGFLHFHHLNPAPPGYRYPYPDFLQLIYVATAADREPDALPVSGGEVPYTFRPIREIQALDLSPSQQLYLQATLRALRP